MPLVWAQAHYKTSLYTINNLSDSRNLNEVVGGAPAIVEIVTQDGRRLRERVDYPKGFAENPFSTEELQRKFIDWSTTRISHHQAR